MRICYVTDERYPSGETDTQQVTMTINALAHEGVDMTLVVPAFPTADHPEGQEAALRSYYGVDGPFEVCPVRTVHPARRGLVKTLHPLSAFRRVSAANPDAVYSRNLQIAFSAVARGYPTMFESYRVIDRRYPRMARLFGRLSCAKNFLGVITHSQVSADGFSRVGVQDEKIRVIHNGFSDAQMHPQLAQAEARQECALPADACIAIYTGHMNPTKGIDVLAKLAAKTPNIQHVWVGGETGRGTEYAEECCRTEGAANVLLPGWVSPPELKAYLYSADILLIPPTSKPLSEHGNTVLPMKTFAYMAAGRAIVAGNQEDIREVLEHGRNGWLVEPGSIESGVEGLQALAADPALRNRLGDTAAKDSEGYTWGARAKKIEAFFEERLGELARG
jgi:glycosyltransferase involved in cell wall biosynthesis